ncbi:MAG: hypothetical protein RMA76_42705 [Deltaproteobacteria bacterium]
MAKKRRRRKAGPSAAPVEGAPDPSSPRWWPPLRAAILSFFIVFSVLSAVPTPGNVTMQKINLKTNRAELLRWVKILDGWGIEVEPDELAQWYVDLAKDLEGIKRTVVAPIGPVQAWTKTHQGWRLFGMPDERPFSLQIVASFGGERRVLYRTASDEHDWNDALFRFRRIRGSFNPGNLYAPGTYDGFARNVSAMVFEEFPDADEVIISMIQTHTTLPGKPKDPTAEERYVRTFTRPKS